MAYIQNSKIFESEKKVILPATITTIDVVVNEDNIKNYSVVSGVLKNTQVGTYVIELVQYFQNQELTKENKYCYVNSMGEAYIRYGFAFVPTNLTTSIKVNVYKVVG